MLRHLTLLILLVAPSLCIAQEIAVIVSAGNPLTALSADQVQQIFLGRPVSLPAGQRLVPVDQPDGKVRDAFYNKLLGRSPGQMKAYWSRIVFTGRGEPPAEMESNRLLATIAADASMVSYVLRSEANSRVRVLLILP